MNGPERPWLYIPDLWPTTTDLRGKEESVYDVLLSECQEHLSQGNVVLYGNVHKEGRLTALFSNEEAVMKYSGRQVKPIKPKEFSYMSTLLEVISSDEFIEEISEMNPRLKGKLPNFNAIFMNWYRPPTETKNVDSLGPHSDDEKSLTSPVILSVTFCQPKGEKLFAFHEKPTEKIVWERELENGSGLVMLEGCQSGYKHSVSNRKTNSKGKITGGRINLTFRQIEVEGKPVKIQSGPLLTLFCKINQANGYMSNWYDSPFDIKGQTFRTVEHYMMWSKAILFGDDQIARMVLETRSPADVKKLGRQVKNFDQEKWANNCVRIVLEGNLAKFQKYPDLAKRLLETGASFIAEAADYDTVWGIGLSADDPKVKDMKNWNGNNYLGKILHDVRRRLQDYKSPLQEYADEHIAEFITKYSKLDWLSVWHKLVASYKN
jgi:ribA/ribD-fused uncharacterized protein